ncbi:hypothetical protein [Rhizobium sp. FY34]|uniref:hypothetical protein n=1 Tax=Rhizobium sp. FY34 TaxID=2562309 RepID=UPI0010C0AD98|nr:hypothetical protein [Rhizobium sp. FY34]
MLLLGWLCLLQIAPTPREVQWINEIYARKENVAREVQGAKYVLIGGSATHYSYSAEVVSKLTGLRVVNLGTHAGLGASYILNRAMRSLNKGDTAVLALEHPMIRPTPPSTILVSHVATSDLDYLRQAPLSQLPYLLFGYSPMQLVRDLASRAIPWNSPLYRSNTVTAFGDESSNTVENKLPYMLNVIRTAAPFGMYALSDMGPTDSLVAFVIWARQHGVNVVYTWPPTTDRLDYLTPTYETYLKAYAAVFEGLGVPVLGKQADYVLPEDEMLDSLYHADVRGARRASAALARNLCAAKLCP